MSRRATGVGPAKRLVLLEYAYSKNTLTHLTLVDLAVVYGRHRLH